MNPLKFRDGLSELLSFLRVLGGVFPRAARNSQHLRADADAAFIQGFNRDLVSLADLTEHVFAPHAAVFENQLAGRRRPNAELVFFLAHRESGKALLDQEGGDTPVAGLRSDGGK